MRATCSAHPIVIYFIASVISGEPYKLWSFSLNNLYSLFLTLLTYIRVPHKAENFLISWTTVSFSVG